MTAFEWSMVALVAMFTAVAAVQDIRTRSIPNWLTVPAFVLALVYHVMGSGWAGLGNSLAGFAVGFGILFVLWLIGGGGGGDVKLMGALGAWVGLKPILMVFFVSAFLAVIGGLIAATISIARRGSLRRGGLKTDLTSEQRAKRRLLPFAVPVAISTWLLLAWQILLHTAEI